jgi:hypothetical protein
MGRPCLSLFIFQLRNYLSDVDTFWYCECALKIFGKFNFNFYLLIKSWGSSFGIATGYKVDDWGSGFGFSGGGGLEMFLFFTASGAHPSSYPMDTGSFDHCGKVAGS